ncbi:MAG: TQO small subunit DoxD [Roseiflexaceae bacterium]|nr:TQO small subunit DoxD [Roseiflexaceae bacterium]
MTNTQQQSAPPELAPSAWERRLQQAVIVVARLGLGVLFLTQLAWKIPPSFGCDADYAFTTADASGTLQRTNGLCDWIGLESVYAQRDRTILAIPINPIAQLNGAFIDTIVKPNIRWFGYLIFLSEALIAVSMLLGVVSRLGALVAIGISAQLMVGLAGIPIPFEWEWSYLLMVLLSILLFGLAPGRIVGLDAMLRPRLAHAAVRNRLARMIWWFT